MPVPSTLTEDTIHKFFSEWRSGSRSQNELADFLESIAVQVVRAAPASAPVTIDTSGFAQAKDLADLRQAFEVMQKAVAEQSHSPVAVGSLDTSEKPLPKHTTSHAAKK